MKWIWRKSWREYQRCRTTLLWVGPHGAGLPMGQFLPNPMGWVSFFMSKNLTHPPNLEVSFLLGGPGWSWVCPRRSIIFLRNSWKSICALKISFQYGILYWYNPQYLLFGQMTKYGIQIISFICFLFKLSVFLFMDKVNHSSSFTYIFCLHY